MARCEEYRGKKPDLIYIFGAKDKDEVNKNVFYEDKENDIMVGYVSHSEEIDYFGYMKKMTLTLHNLVMIKRGQQRRPAGRHQRSCTIYKGDT